MAEGWSSDAGLGSGLPDRFKFTVQNAKVDNPYEKAPDVVAVVLDGERQIEGDDPEEDHLWLKPGAFEAGDKEGTFLVHETQSADIFDTRAERIKKINNKSGYGKFLGSIIDVAGIETLINNQDPARAKFEIWDVKMLEGLVLDIEMVEEKFDVKDKTSGEMVTVTSRVPYVRAVLGKSDASGATASTPEAQSSAASNGKIDEAGAAELAKGAKSFVKYLETLTEEHGVDAGHEWASKAFYDKANA